jgi:hypothetical protein
MSRDGQELVQLTYRANAPTVQASGGDDGWKLVDLAHFARFIEHAVKLNDVSSAGADNAHAVNVDEEFGCAEKEMSIASPLELNVGNDSEVGGAGAELWRFSDVVAANAVRGAFVTEVEVIAEVGFLHRSMLTHGRAK